MAGRPPSAEQPVSVRAILASLVVSIAAIVPATTVCKKLLTSLDKDTAAAISAAWTRDKRRVWETLLVVPHKVTNELIPYRYSPALSYLESQLSGKDYVLKSRQLYTTTYFQLTDLYSAMMTPNYNSLLLTDKDDEAKLYHDKYLFFYNQFPEMLEVVPAFPILFRPKLVTDNNNLLEFQHDEGNSYLHISSARSNIVGRGVTLHNIHFPEFAICEDEFAKEALASALGAASPTTTIKLETTAKGGGRYAHKLWLQSKVGDSFFKPIFLPWTLDDTARLSGTSLLENISEYETAIMRDYGADTVRYYRWAQTKFGEKAKQELAEDDITCFLLSGRTVFNQDIISEYLQRCIAPLSYDAESELFQLARPGSRYVIGVDCMEGLSERGDFHTIVIGNVKTLEVVATFRSHCSIPELVAKIVELGKQYGNAFVVIERNSYGAVVCQYLSESGYRNIYTGDDGKLGWFTSRTSKPLMVESFKRVLADRSFLCNSKRIWEEARSFLYLGGAQMGATGDFHDDLIMATMLMLQGIENYAEVGDNTVRIMRGGF